MKRATVYLAGPIAGCTWDEAVDWRSWATQMLPECDTRSPMRGKEFLRELDQTIPAGGDDVQSNELAKEAVDAAVSTQHAIVVRDHWDVNTADVLLVNLLPSMALQKSSIGTAFELAWAWKYQKPAVVVMQDIGNPNSHPFVREAAYIVVPQLESAIAVVRQLLNLSPTPEEKDGIYIGSERMLVEER